jgi:hypothetical protein
LEILLSASLYFSFGLFLCFTRFLRTKTQILECLPNTFSRSEPVENRALGYGWKSGAKILGQSRSRNVLAKLQIWIRQQRRLIARAQIVRVRVQGVRYTRMIPQVAIGAVQIVASNPSPV